MIYMTVSTQGRTLSWIDRQQNLLLPAGNVVIDATAYLSIDDSRIVYDSYDPVARNFDIWTLDIARGLKSRLTFDQADDSNPVSSPDGKRFVCTSWKEGVNLYLKSLSGSDTPDLLAKSITSAQSTDWSRDGKYILFQDVELTADWDIWYVSLDGERAKKPFVKTEFSEANAVFSPDGRWVAYQSDESSRNEVYVRSFPTGDGKWQVSTGGGRSPLWDKTGSAIYYNTEQGVMATAVNGSGAGFSTGDTKLVFRNPSQAGLQLHGVTADGKRILVSHLPTSQVTMPLTLVTDWRRTIEGNKPGDDRPTISLPIFDGALSDEVGGTGA